MTGILADNNIVGQVTLMVRIWQSRYWREIWESLALSVFTFDEIGLAASAADAEIWLECQRRGIVFITANRNDEDEKSLEATLRDHNTPSCLPVFTLADADRVLKDKEYAKRVAERLLDYLFRIERVLGSGRLYVP